MIDTKSCGNRLFLSEIHSFIAFYFFSFLEDIIPMESPWYISGRIIRE